MVFAWDFRKGGTGPRGAGLFRVDSRPPSPEKRGAKASGCLCGGRRDAQYHRPEGGILSCGLLRSPLRIHGRGQGEKPVVGILGPR